MLKDDFKRLISDAMPRYYDDLIEAQEIIDSQAQMHADIYAAVQDVLAQFFIDTATWGLLAWEEICGIPTDVNKPIAERRSKVKAQMRGVGTVTAALIENVAESWYGGDVNVIESPSTYTITVKFVSSFGTPSNLADVEAALRALIPAHLALEFEFSYLLIRDIHGVKTLSDMGALTLDKFAGGA